VVTPTGKPAKRKSVSLTGQGEKLTILAQRKRDGTATEFVDTTLCAAAGVKRISTHGLRHTSATLSLAQVCRRTSSKGNWDTRRFKTHWTWLRPNQPLPNQPSRRAIANENRAELHKTHLTYRTVS